MIKVKVIRFDGEAAVIQYNDRRVVVPRSAINKTHHCDRQVVECGIPYGVDFEALFDGIQATTAEDISREFHKVGIWTIDDVMADSRKVRQAISTAHGTLLSTVLNRVRALKR